MKYCCEKCFSGEENFRDYLIKNHEKTGTCDYCGEKSVKLIEVTKMRKPFFDLINDRFDIIDKSETSCMGEDYYVYGDEPVESLDNVFGYLEDTYLADNDWQLNEELFFDLCTNEDDEVFYLRK